MWHHLPYHFPLIVGITHHKPLPKNMCHTHGWPQHIRPVQTGLITFQWVCLFLCFFQTSNAKHFYHFSSCSGSKITRDMCCLYMHWPPSTFACKINVMYIVYLFFISSTCLNPGLNSWYWKCQDFGRSFAWFLCILEGSGNTFSGLSFPILLYFLMVVFTWSSAFPFSQVVFGVIIHLDAVSCTFYQEFLVNPKRVMNLSSVNWPNWVFRIIISHKLRIQYCDNDRLGIIAQHFSS